MGVAVISLPRRDEPFSRVGTPRRRVDGRVASGAVGPLPPDADDSAPISISLLAAMLPL